MSIPKWTPKQLERPSHIGIGVFWPAVDLIRCDDRDDRDETKRLRRCQHASKSPRHKLQPRCRSLLAMSPSIHVARRRVRYRTLDRFLIQHWVRIRENHGRQLAFSGDAATMTRADAMRQSIFSFAIVDGRRDLWFKDHGSTPTRRERTNAVHLSYPWCRTPGSFIN